MSKPDFTADIEKLADRSEQLRALVADQRKEESGGETVQRESASRITRSKPRSATANRNDATIHEAKQHRESQPPLSAAIERLLDPDHPEHIGDDNRQWSRRLTYISTRIPEDMRDLIDDLLFVLRKEARKELGREPTLQDLACEAWSDLLAKYRSRSFPA